LADIQSFDYSKLIGRTFGNFVVVRELGRGAMGAVFTGYQKSLKRQVAIKLLPKALAATDRARQQFRDEAETTALLDHPNIITIFESGEDDEYFFQVMQLIDGRDLDWLIQRLRRHPVPARRRMPMQHALRLVGEMLDGLAYAHEEGVIHQDLKPANILVDNRTGRALIADFGIAKTKQIEFFARGMTVGTPKYLSPEQAAAEDTDCRTDIYAAGVIPFELLAGVLPVRDENARATVARKVNAPDSFFLRRPIDCGPPIDRAMAAIIERATAADRDRRYGSCSSFATALRKWSSARQSAVS